MAHAREAGGLFHMMTPEECLREIEAHLKRVNNEMEEHKARFDREYGMKSTSSLVTPQEECKVLTREIELLVRRAQQASPNGKIYLPPVVHQLSDELAGGVTMEKRLALLKEVRDHLVTTDLRRYYSRWTR